jgi:hypothetical protein
MGMDDELLELDGLGIFPRCSESEEEYVKRGWATVEYSDKKEQDRLVGRFLEISEWANSERVRDGLVKKAAEMMAERYGCDMSWLDVYYADTNFPDEKTTKGFSMTQDRTLIGKLEHHTPPFAVIRRRKLVPDMPVLLHEMVHVARKISHLNSYEKLESIRDYEELCAYSMMGCWQFPRHIRYMFSEGSSNYHMVRNTMHRAFGSMAGYALIRTSYVDALDMGIGHSADYARDYICERAEREAHDSPRLRYQIIKEKLGL